jgi:hypothetical protein
MLKLLYKRSGRMSTNKLSLPFWFLVHKVIRTMGRKRIGSRGLVTATYKGSRGYG